jgi:hypothetical protein
MAGAHRQALLMRSSFHTGAWKNWDAHEWGRALLHHYFMGDDARPVSRLAISPEELARAAGAPESDASAVRDAFLQSVRCAPTSFRRRLSSASLTAWNRRAEPPFLAHLLFTCFAAASLDANTADEGVFRERIRQLLGHEEGTTYSLSDLSRLWEAFAAWLQKRHDAGELYRPLILPERGRLNLIGYSVRLAFPGREDRLRLLNTLAASGIAANPTVPEAFQAITRARARFSAAFLRVFDQARAAVAKGRDVPELHALWSAILEVLPLAARAARRKERVRYQVIAQEDDLAHVQPFVVAAGALPGNSAGIDLSLLDEPFEDFTHFLVTGERTDLIARLLLMGGLDDKVADFRASPIPRAVREGVLLFRQVDSSTWDLAVTRPSEGKARALVRSYLIESFIRLVPPAKRQSRDTRFEGWRETVAFDAAELAEPNKSLSPDLTSVRCLQRVEVGLQLHLMDGIRVEDGYLGFSGLRPEVHCTEVTHVQLIRRAGEAEDSRVTEVATLAQVIDRPGVFGWVPDDNDLDGAHLLVGSQRDRVLARRRVNFHSRVLSFDYKMPTDPTRWFVEGCSSDVVPAGEASNRFVASDVSRPAPLPAAEALHDEAARVFTKCSIDDSTRHDHLVEALAAIASGKKGIPEAELIEIVTKIVGYAGPTIWEIIRGWQEAGYLDCLSKRQWHGRVYFARHPTLVLVPDPDAQSIRCQLYGLAPYRLRCAARNAFGRALATALPSLSMSPSVPAPEAWRFESLEHASAAIADLGELETIGVCEPQELVGDFDAVVCDDLALPPGYELQRVWDWEAGRFRRSDRARHADEVRIEYHTRSNGPDRYVVDVNGRRRTTLSRSWALLDGFRRAGRIAFAPLGSTAIVRIGGDGPQLPLPLARTIGLRSGIVGGPAETGALGQYYAYAAESPSVRRWLLAWVVGQRADEELTRRFAWLRAVASERMPEAHPLPNDIRQRLRNLASVPDAVFVADCRFPRHFVHHLRRAVMLAEA